MVNEVIETRIIKPFGNLYRNATTLIAIRDGSGKFVFGNKENFYPAGITRLLGGGVKAGELPIDGAIRELKEEVGIDIEKNDLIVLGEVKVIAVDSNKTYEMTTYLYFYEAKSGTLIAGDDVTDFSYLSREEFSKLVENFYRLTDDMWFDHDGENFSWGDYGRVYGRIHQLVLSEMDKLTI